jgi:hypothetical protein
MPDPTLITAPTPPSSQQFISRLKDFLAVMGKVKKARR